MNTLIIEIPEGHEIDNFDKKTGVVSFKKATPKSVTERLLTVDDVLKELGEQDLDVIQYRKILAAGLESHLVNFQLAIIIAKAFNEGWIADWSKSNEYKYYPWFKIADFSYGNYSDWGSYSYASARLCFKSSKLAEFAGKQFTEVYKSFMK